MSTFNLNSSCAIRAEQHSGRLLWAASSMVLTFQHATFSIFALYLGRGRTFLVLMFWDHLRRCLLTAVSQLGDERRASVRPPFLGLSPCGARSTVSKESWLVVQGALGWCFCLRSTIDDQYHACKIGTVASSDIYYLPFRPFPIATGLGSVGGVADVDLSFQPAQWSFLVKCSVRSTGLTLYTRGSSLMA